MHNTNKRNVTLVGDVHHPTHLHRTQPQSPNNKHSQIPRYPHPRSTLNRYTHINKTAHRANTHSAFLHGNIRTCPCRTKHLAYTTLVGPTSHLRICQHHYVTHIQLPTSTNLKQYNAQQTHNVPLTLAQGYILVTEF